jgi:hypothetical protein
MRLQPLTEPPSDQETFPLPAVSEVPRSAVRLTLNIPQESTRFDYW